MFVTKHLIITHLAIFVFSMFRRIKRPQCCQNTNQIMGNSISQEMLFPTNILHCLDRQGEFDTGLLQKYTTSRHW